MNTPERKESIVKLSDREFPIPYWEVNSGKRGPVLLITCALHGNEVQGVEAMRRLLPVFSKDLLCGSVLLVPFANPLAVRHRRPHMDSGPETPYGGPGILNINSAWPGKENGDARERITLALRRDLVDRATHNVDLHAWPGVRASTALFRKDNPGATEMARHAAFRFAEGRVGKPVPNPPPGPSTLTGWFIDTGRTAICLEPSGQYRFVPREVKRTERALLNCSKLLGLLPGDPEGLDEPVIWIAEAEKFEVTAPHPGLFSPAELETSDYVEEGQILGHLIGDPSLAIQEIRAPASGYLWAFGRWHAQHDVSLAAQHPYADAGEKLAVIVRNPQ